MGSQMSKFAAIESQVIQSIINPEGHTVPVEFVKRSVMDKVETEKTGIRKFKEVEFIKFYKSKLSVFEEEVTEEHRQRYAKQYQQFKDKHKQKEEGIPIGMLPNISQTEIDNLEAHRIYTVERLSIASMNVLQQVGFGAIKLQERAKAYLQQSSSSELELKETKAKLEAMEKQIQELTEKQNEPIDNSAERGGRSPAVRKTNNSNRKQQQGNKAEPIVTE
jgi:hypothetical protein